MWKEPSSGLSATSTNPGTINKNKPIPAVVESVEPGSIGEAIGFEKGDKLMSINGFHPRDLIDYQFLIVDEELHLEVIDKNGELHTVDLEKDADDALGLVFTEALFDGLKQCNNHCPFCFIDQQPPGKRESLYLKDDDFRLSFLYGSYLTLTNLTEADWHRIEEQRLSPLFVSVHATDPNLRTKLLKNPRAGQLKEQLHWFAKRNLQIHAQVVVCPGLNDGQALENTLCDLAKHAEGDWPSVLSTAVVPVGLTRFRPMNDKLIPVSDICAKKVINQVELLQKQFKAHLGSNFAWLSDEWYLIAGQSLPPRQKYEDLPQQQNGVGSIRAFLEEMDIATRKLPKKLPSPKKSSWVVGRLVSKALAPACQRLNRVEGLTVLIYGLPSPHWGQEQIVTGLLTGEDLLKGLKGQELGDELLLPSIMLRHDEDLFLDDMTLSEFKQSLDIPVRVVHGAQDIVKTLMGDSSEIR